MPLTKAGIARLHSLREKKHREALGLFVVEGEKVVGELLAAGYCFEEIFVTADWPGETSPAKLHSIGAKSDPPQATVVSAAEMARISHYPTPSPVLAVGKIQPRPLERGGLDRGLTLALDGVQDPGNVGAILRIADWFALDRVLLSPDCADLFSQKVINASMGSFARVTVHVTALPEALAGCKAPVLGCDLAGDDVHAFVFPRDAVVVIGSEGRGISSAVASHLSRRITIPRFGGAESLNAAVAAAIVCDNLRRLIP
jgi:RNA methyltransferase, TrmH family